MCKMPRYLLILAVLFCFPSIAFAEKPAPLHVHEQDAVTIKLMPGACEDPTTLMLIAMNLPPEAHDKFRAIDSNWLMKDGSRRDYAGCWLEDGDTFLLIFSDATGQRVKKSDFNKRKGMVNT